MAVIHESCVDRGNCLVRRTGHCTYAESLGKQTAYFDIPKLAKQFKELGEEEFDKIVIKYADKKLDICLLPDELRASAERARARALTFFHPK